MNKEQIDLQLQLIFKSPEFVNSKIYRDLLTFLVNYSLKGEMPKEINIAIEFFKKETSFDSSSDSTVRSHLHHLRKKLDSYYRNDGKEDTIQLVIPKGHYVVNFINTQSKKATTNKKAGLVLFAIILCLAGFIVGQLYKPLKSDYSVIPKDQVIWRDFFKKDKPVLVILGDHYFYMGPSSTTSSAAIRDFEINSDSDLNEFLYHHPNQIKAVSKTSHTYMTKRIPWAIYSFFPSFVVYNKLIDIKLASDVQWDDFQKYDILFIGAFRSLGVSNKIIEDLPFSYNDKKGILTLAVNDTTNVTYNAGNCSDFQTEMQDAKDYAMVIKTKGPNANDCLFFLSTHDIGIISIIRQFTHLEQLESFTQKYLNQNSFDSFYSVFQVQGVARTDFQMKLLHHQLFYSSDY